MAAVTRLPLQYSEPQYDPPGRPPGEAEALNPRRLLGALIRRKVLIGGIMAVVTALAVLAVTQITPLYRASTSIVVETARQNLINIDPVTQSLITDYYTNATQAAVIGSRALAAQAVDALNLHNHPLFNPEMSSPEMGPFELLISLVKHWAGFEETLLGDAQPAAPPSPWAGMAPEQKHAAQREYLTDAYLGGLSVVPSERSRVLVIEYVSSDPKFAALAANTTAQIYIRDQLRTKGDASAKASDWLNDRVQELRQRVIDSDRKLEEFRRDSGIIELGGTTTLREQVSKLNAELFEATTTRSEAEARYNQVQALLRNRGGVETAAAVLDSSLIQRLREQEVVLARKLAELRTQLREGHPRMVLAENELADLQSKIAQEVSKIAINLGNELQIARVRENNLRSELNRLETQLGRQNDAEVTLRALMSESQANKQLYETVLARYKQTNVVDGELQQADARVISAAVVPSAPFYPQKRLMVLAALVVSGIIATALALLLEFLDTGFRSMSELESVTGLPVLGSVPAIRRRRRGPPPHQIAIRSPNSAFGEAIRSLRTALILSDIERAPKTVLITSALPGEGKTSVSLSLAALTARSGQRAIILDCDLRHADIDRVLGQPNRVGLAEYLSGHARLEDVIEIDPESGLHFIAAGNRVPHPAEMLGSRQMRSLLETLRSMYELVVLDSPPLLAVSDSLVLVRYVDKTVFLVRWERTRRDTVIAGVKQVIDAGADLAGMVLSQVDLKKQARYGYAYGGYYDYHRASKYYSE